MPGPLPKPANQCRARRRTTLPTLTVPSSPADGGVAWGDPDPSWHPMAIETFNSLACSQQASLAQPSDVAMARFACEGMTRTLGASKFSALAFKATCDVLNDLGASLGSRLRLRLEFERSDNGEAARGAAEAARLRVMLGGGK